MTALALDWFEDEDPRDLRRWAMAAALVLGIHLAAIAGYLYVHQPDEVGDDSSPVAIELAPTDDTVDQTEVAPEPEAPPKPIEQPPPDTSQAVVAPIEEKPPEKVEEQKPPVQAMPARTKGGAPRVEPAYLSAIFKHLVRYKPPYPNQAEEGVVNVGFTLDRNGHVLDLNIIHSSG